MVVVVVDGVVCSSTIMDFHENSFGSTIVIAQGSYIPTLESIQFDLKIPKFGLPKRTVLGREP